MKLLFSWIAYNNDFENGKVDPDGPTMTFHKHYFNHDRHLILSSAREDDIRIIHLINKISSTYPQRAELVEPVYMNVQDVINLEEIKNKVEKLLLRYREDEIDIFFSPGTSIMQVCWYICHSTLGLNTRLFQTRPSRFYKDKKNVELIEIKTDQSTTPVTAIIKEELLGGKDIFKQDILITESIKPAYEKAFKIAQADGITTLIFGESGTGKENLAKYIHDHSCRKKRPFITVNCSAMGENLLESRLFGYKKGAFTGAEKDTKGLFELADGGTIFLDEIGDISSYMQQSLLRVIQNKEILPLGGTVKKIDVRIISATNKELKKLCSIEKFRWDLYYRLTVTYLELPSLHELERDEKENLIQYLIRKKMKQFRRSTRLTLSKETLRILLDYPFPGNIRELENLIDSLYVFHAEQVEVDNLPRNLREIEPAYSFRWKDAEKLHIQKVLNYFHGNKNRTYKALGYGSINTLNKKIRDYGILFTIHPGSG
jgi:transcriptional regulator with PAS, ATPase and Fis domain